MVGTDTAIYICEFLVSNMNNKFLITLGTMLETRLKVSSIVSF